MRPLPLLPLVVLLSVIAPACGGSPSSPPVTMIAFTAGAAPPPSNSIAFQLASATATTLTVNVVATDVASLSSVYFDLVFNQAVFQYQSAALAPFLGSSGGNAQITVPTDAALLAAANAAGRVPVSLNLLPATVGASGSGVLGTITMRYVADGTSVVAFEATGALMPFPGLPVPGLQFVSSSATARTR